jgi:diguanylate cyclase (GGDEF)-like protein
MNKPGTARIESFIDSLGAACLVVSDEGDIIAANHRAEHLYAADRSQIVGHVLSELCADIDRRLVEGVLGACNGDTTEFTARAKRVDGSSFLGEFTATRQHLDEADCDFLVLVIRELEEDLTACQVDLELHQLMLEGALDGIIAHSVEGELLYANHAAEEQWGYSIEEARRRGPWGWISEQNRSSVTARMAHMIEHGQARFESHRTLADGREVHQEIHARLVASSHGRVVVSTTRDISERVRAEEMVRHLAYHDILTGLANRSLLDQTLQAAVASAERHGDLVGVVFIDLDEFKPINDTHGHLVGDDVLRVVAQRLTSCVRDYDTVARLGGDEFVVVFPRLAEPEDLVAVTHKLVEEVSRPIKVPAGEVVVEPSIGYALRRMGEDAAALLTRADLHMYEVRERKRPSSKSHHAK